MWKALDIAQKGSEGGIVLNDEEYKGICRITLEKCERYYAITCGIYGAMCHTAFCGDEDHMEKYDAMKKELQELKESAEELKNQLDESGKEPGMLRLTDDILKKADELISRL